MGVSQISVFLQSEPGHLLRILDEFEDAGVNVRGYCAADTGDYGIVRFIVDDPDTAVRVLQDSGAAVVVTDVIVVLLDDIPGEFARMARIMASCGINVLYGYSLISTAIAFKVDDTKKAEELLAKQPIRLLVQADLNDAAPIGE